MAATPSKEDALLVSQCLDFCQMLAGKSIPFSFCLKVGHNSFSVDTRGKGALSSAKKKKKPTPSTLRRNARRREEFLQKKLASTTPVSKPVSEQGTEDLRKPPELLRHHASPSPSSERRQVITVGKGKVPTFNQLDGAAGSPAAKTSGPPPSQPCPPPPYDKPCPGLICTPHGPEARGAGAYWETDCDQCFQHLCNYGKIAEICSANCGLHHCHKKVPGDNVVWSFRSRGCREECTKDQFCFNCSCCQSPYQ